MIRKIFVGLLIFLLANVSEAATLTGKTELKDLRYSLGSGVVRIVLDLEKRVQFKESYAENPSRLIVSLSNTWIDVKKMKKTIELDSTAAKYIKVAQFDPSTVRIVVETMANVKIFWLEGGPAGQRLVIDVGNVPFKPESEQPKETSPPKTSDEKSSTKTSKDADKTSTKKDDKTSTKDADKSSTKKDTEKSSSKTSKDKSSEKEIDRDKDGEKEIKNIEELEIIVDAPFENPDDDNQSDEKSSKSKDKDKKSSTKKDDKTSTKKDTEKSSSKTSKDKDKKTSTKKDDKTSKKDESSEPLDELDKDLENIMKLKGKTIVLDAGHGGGDAGAIGPTGVTEKSVTLRVALELEKLLKAEGAKVIMTRKTDKAVSSKGDKASAIEELQARCDVANKTDADIFISIHADSFTNPAARGTTGYYYSQSSSNKAQKLADAIRKALCEQLRTPSRGTKPCNFYVVRHTAMTATLVELAFISNPEEEELLDSDEGIMKAAQGILDGIEDYFG